MIGSFVTTAPSLHRFTRLAVAVGCIGLVVAIAGCPKASDSTDPAAQEQAQSLADDGQGSTPDKPIAVAAAPKPTGPLPPEASCITPECHATFQAENHVHQPVGVGSCSACHEPDLGSHQFPLTRTGNDMCTYCHPVAGTEMYQHQAINDGGCMACHDPHAGPTNFLLKASSTRALCEQCHIVEAQRFEHQPFAFGECAACHEPHQSANSKLLRGGEGADHCRLCHEAMDEKLTKAQFVHAPALDACLNCHTAHGAAQPYLLAAPVKDNCLSCHDSMASQIEAAPVSHSAITQVDSCVNCHDPHASDRDRILSDRPDRLCLQCHNQPLQTPDGRTVASMWPVLDASYLHGPVRDGQCADCHDSHGATFTSLLRKPAPPGFYAPFDIDNYQLCFSCHNQQLVLEAQTDQLTGFRDGQRNLHYLHVNREQRGRTCKTCHAMHGSDNPNHVAQSVPFEGSQWQMPIQFKKLDDGGSCSPACHETMRYSRLTTLSTAGSQTP